MVFYLTETVLRWPRRGIMRGKKAGRSQKNAAPGKPGPANWRNELQQNKRNKAKKGRPRTPLSQATTKNGKET